MKKQLLFNLICVGCHGAALSPTTHQANLAEPITAQGGAQPISFTRYQLATKFYSPDGKYMTNNRSKAAGLPLAANVSCGAKHDLPTGAQFASSRIMSSPTLRGARHVYQPPAYDTLFSQYNLGSQWKNVISLISSTGAAYTTLLDAGTMNSMLTDKNFHQEVHPHTSSQTYPNARAISYFVPIFRKIQFCVLHDLYMYLMSLYSTFTLTHADPADYAILSEKTALDRKALIVNEFVNILQTQMKGICSAQSPTAPTHMVIRTGSTAITHDSTGDLLILLQDYSLPLYEGDDGTSQEHALLQQQLESARQDYLTALGSVIHFFTAYTELLNPTHYETFIDLAKSLQDTNDNDPFTVQGQQIAQLSSVPSGTPITISKKPQTSPEEKTLRAQVLGPQQPLVKKFSQLRQLKDTTLSINPLFFYYDDQTFRSIKLIIATAQSLQGRIIENVPLPPFLIEQAIKAAKKDPSALITTSGTSYPVAFVENANCTMVTANIDPQNNAEQTLYINLRTAQGPYTQEIKRQPTWLNDPEKIIQMLQACLGNWTYLIGQSKIDAILDPCTEHLLAMAVNASQTGSSTVPVLPSETVCSEILQQITKVQQQYIQHKQPNTDPTPQGPICMPQGKS